MPVQFSLLLKTVRFLGIRTSFLMSVATDGKNGGHYFKYFRLRGAIIQGTAIIRGNTVGKVAKVSIEQSTELTYI